MIIERAYKHILVHALFFFVLYKGKMWCKKTGCTFFLCFIYFLLYTLCHIPSTGLKVILFLPSYDYIFFSRWYWFEIVVQLFQEWIFNM